jgi:hypothetical protein
MGDHPGSDQEQNPDGELKPIAWALIAALIEAPGAHGEHDDEADDER